MTAGVVAMAKYNNARKARRVAELARETMGGNGVLIENHVARLFTDAEAVYTYEGSNEINLLVAGRELTGIGAFV
jgi:glutaryl-CoA dehydrogenase